MVKSNAENMSEEHQAYMTACKMSIDYHNNYTVCLHASSEKWFDSKLHIG